MDIFLSFAVFRATVYDFCHLYNDEEIIKAEDLIKANKLDDEEGDVFVVKGE